MTTLGCRCERFPADCARVNIGRFDWWLMGRDSHLFARRAEGRGGTHPAQPPLPAGDDRLSWAV